MRQQQFTVMPVLIILCCLLSILASSKASAQSSWLQSGKELLGTLTQKTQTGPGALSDTEITMGLREALRVGTRRVIDQLGRENGFNNDPAVHIPLPDNLLRVKKALSAVGMSALLDDLELKLNRAAEAAAPPAKQLFWDAIETMTLEDVQQIYNGPNDAATRYLETKMAAPLAEAMRPIVDQTLDQVGAIQAYDAVMGQYAILPYMPDVKANLQQHVVDKGMAGIFYYLAKEEAAIRENPAKRTTEILQKVFGAD